jgi:hypothetical protein
LPDARVGQTTPPETQPEDTTGAVETPPADKERIVYIGVGAIVLILIIVLVVFLLRR